MDFGTTRPKIDRMPARMVGTRRGLMILKKTTFCFVALSKRIFSLKLCVVLMTKGLIMWTLVQ
jgi:hypothetical protein